MGNERLRPTSGAYRQYTIAGIAVGLGLAVSALVRLRGEPGFAAVLAAGIALAALACVPLVARHEGVLIGPGRITRTNLLGLSRGFAPSEVYTVVLAHAFVTPGSLRQSAHTASTLFLLDAHGAPLLRMHGDFWAPEAIQEVVAAVGVPPLEIAEPVTAAALRSRFPAALGYRESHPVLAAVVLGLLVATALVALTVVFARAL